jgi:hypothetical protein
MGAQAALHQAAELEGAGAREREDIVHHEETIRRSIASAISSTTLCRLLVRTLRPQNQADEQYVQFIGQPREVTTVTGIS